MNMNPQTILVVMPVYNSEKTLRKAIESVLGQVYKNIALVIVDDASTDNSLEIAKSYSKDKRIFILKNNENRGAYYSRNLGLYFFKNMNWGYFTTHDADDVSFPDRYLKMLKILKRDKISAVQDTFRRIDLKTNKIISEKITMAHAVFKREVFEAVGYFETVRFAGDWEHWQRVMSSNREKGLTVAAIKEVVGESYIHENNLTVLIPIRSHQRLQYVKDANRNLANMNKNGLWYVPFIPSTVSEVVQ
jgi:glycosyltransferase involved in cell wall biosynthesis